MTNHLLWYELIQDRKHISAAKLVCYSNGRFENCFKERCHIKTVTVTLVVHKHTLREIFVLAAEHGK